TSIPYNVSGVGYGLKLTGPILANIYLGHIKKWNDKRIEALNKGMKLPDENIVPIYRSDASGTSFNFSDYLSHVSKEWKSKIGTFTWVILPLQSSKAADLKKFVDWAVTKGQSFGPKLLFLPLPKAVQAAARHTLARVHS